MANWVTIEKAAADKGLSMSLLHERTGPGGHWVEGEVWKWWEGRKMVDLDQLNDLISGAKSTPSNRGRRRDTASNDPCPEPQATLRAS